MPAEQVFQVSEEQAGMRLDIYLSCMLPDVSRSRIQSLIKAGKVLLNGAPAKAKEPVGANDQVTWDEPPAVPCETAGAEDIALDILYEDDSLIVLNKPAGMVVHPGAGHAHGTLVSALLHHCGSLSSIGGVERPGIVHRLDKETSGCIVVAKTDVAHQSLSEQFANREIKKTYLAVTGIVPRQRKGTINAPIARHRVHRQKMTVTEGRGREAVSDYLVLAEAPNRCLIECKPHTGRTHQIRVHLKYLGTPILGDILYGKRGDFDRHMLHAWKLEFRHPVTGEQMAFEATPPAEFRIS